jgi:Amt family ammonium transporter
MNRPLLCLALLTTLATSQISVRADAPVPKRADPTVEQRLEDLEAYMNNGARVADNNTNVSSKLGSYDDKANSFTPNPGPGANAWQMTSAALVL